MKRTNSNVHCRDCTSLAMLCRQILILTAYVSIEIMKSTLAEDWPLVSGLSK